MFACYIKEKMKTLVEMGISSKVFNDELGIRTIGCLWLGQMKPNDWANSYITATFTELQPFIYREYIRVQSITFHIKRNDVHPLQGYNVSRKLPSHTTREDNSLLSFTSLLHYWESSFPPSLMTTPGREERSHSSCWIHMCKNLKPNQSINQS